MTNPVVPDGAMIVIPDLAASVGLLKALILQDLYTVQIGAQATDGWVERSRADWQERFPFVSARHLRRVISGLRDDELIRVQPGYVNWFQVDYVKVRGLKLEYGQDGRDRMSAPRKVSGESDKSGLGQNVRPSDRLSLLRNTSATIGASNSNTIAQHTASSCDDTSSCDGSEQPAETPPPTPKVKKVEYDHSHYDWTPKVWAEIRAGGALPDKERPHTVIIGFFLLAMMKAHNKRITIAAREFSGKLVVQAKQCLEYFEAQDRPEGVTAIAATLDYVKWFVTTADSDWIVTNGRSIQIIFTVGTYRDECQKAQMGRPSKSMDRKRKGALALSDSPMISEDSAEARRALKVKVF